MNVLLIGSGAREHAMALSLSQSRLLARLFVSPGNPGCAEAAEIVALDIDDHNAVIDFCRAKAIDLVVVGPEGPLVAGIADALRAVGVLCFGPSKYAASLEGSKIFTKQFCDEFRIPTAKYKTFDRQESAAEFIRSARFPVVVKADGLAAGKGVTIAANAEEALAAVFECLGGRFGGAGAQVVIEEFLQGQEISAFALSDGDHAVWFGEAQDHKRVGDGDTGPNTGGMGAYSPTNLVDDALKARIMAEIFEPTVQGMRARGAPFRGVLFAGLMLLEEGPKLIEFNVRFGDPEAQVLFARITSDPLELFTACARGQLGALEPIFDDDCAIGVVLATRGYPGSVECGSQILGIPAAKSHAGVRVLQAATILRAGVLCSNGGRVLTVVAVGPNLRTAQHDAYRAVEEIRWPEGFFRRDIGDKGLREPESNGPGRT